MTAPPTRQDRLAAVPTAHHPIDDFCMLDSYPPWYAPPQRSRLGSQRSFAHLHGLSSFPFWPRVNQILDPPVKEGGYRMPSQ
jgi:hypothetical protein